mgnify:CR=1 FL=1
MPADNKEYEWIDKINKSCIISNIDKNEIKKRIEKNVEKYGGKEKAVTIFDPYTMKSKLRELSKSSESPLVAEKSTKRIFNKDMVSDIIINEYLDCSQWLINERNSNLTLANANLFTWNLNLCHFKSKKIIIMLAIYLKQKLNI